MKGQSLAAKSGALQEFKLPETFSAPQEPIVARTISPYITFAHPKRADEWARIAGAFGGVEEGSMFLITTEEVHKLDTVKCHWLCHRQYWAEANAAGELIRVSFQEKPRPFKENVEAVLLVYVGGAVVPANASFRSTKCAAARTMSDALQEAATPRWAERSPAHKETLVCAQPFARFYGEISLAEKRISKSNGLPYRVTRAIVKPTGAPEWRALKEFQDTEGSQKKLEDVSRRFELRIAEVKVKV